MLKIKIVLTSLMLIWTSAAYSQIEFSGFADILYSGYEGAGEFGYGQFEIDLSTEISPWASIEGAVAYNAESGTFEAGAGFIDLHWGGEANHPFAAWGMLIGQFDVPFGIDYLHIPSPDRFLVTAPLANQFTIDSWNDIGLSLYGSVGLFEVVTYVVNGAGNGSACGGRLGTRSDALLSVGSSLNVQSSANEVGGTPQTFGLDARLNAEPFCAKAEYYHAKAFAGADFDSFDNSVESSGYYAQFGYCLGEVIGHPLMLLTRYGTWSAINGLDSDGNENHDAATRITTGVRYYPIDGFELRLEYNHYNWETEAPEGQFQLQTVVAF